MNLRDLIENLLTGWQETKTRKRLRGHKIFVNVQRVGESIIKTTIMVAMPLSETMINMQSTSAEERRSTKPD